MSIPVLSDLSGQTAFDRGVFAARRHAWGEAARLFARAANAPGAGAAARCNLAAAMVQLACHRQAARQLDIAARMAPDAPRILEDRARLAAWRAISRDSIGTDRLTTGAGLGALLAPHHAAAVFRAAADGDVQRFARLPAFGSVAETRRWLVWQRLRGDRVSVGIVDPEDGVIGAVSLKTAGDRGRFSFWIGARHRGRGRGRGALRLLNALARRTGCTALWSDVDADNHVSRHVLCRAGFTRHPGRRQDRLHIRTEDLAC